VCVLVETVVAPAEHDTSQQPTESQLTGVVGSAQGCPGIIVNLFAVHYVVHVNSILPALVGHSGPPKNECTLSLTALVSTFPVH